MLLLGPKVRRLPGDDTELRTGFWIGGSSSNRRRLALPAAGELYLSWTDSGEGGTSGTKSELRFNHFDPDLFHSLRYVKT